MSQCNPSSIGGSVDLPSNLTDLSAVVKDTCSDEVLEPAKVSNRSVLQGSGVFDGMNSIVFSVVHAEKRPEP